jgi:lysozyme family protein
MLAELSNYLGRAATLDELRNLQIGNVRAIYKKQYAGPAAGIEVPLVRAAYFNFAAWLGIRHAITILQKAEWKVVGRNGQADGILGPSSINLLNSGPDPNLLVETADCILIEELKGMQAFQVFGKSWILRVRAFSPAVWHGVCSELPANGSIAGADRETNASAAGRPIRRV